jgi:hypothetical protein
MAPSSALRRLALVALTSTLASAHTPHALAGSVATPESNSTRTVNLSGHGFDDLKNAIVHWTRPTATGTIQQSTEIVELYGDLRGRVLYHVTTVIDFVTGTLVNTGDQVYSGTVAGSLPVMLHDDQFRFEVNLNTGEESGQVYLLDHITGPKVTCVLKGVGTGLNADGNPTFTYSGTCTFRGE